METKSSDSGRQERPRRRLTVVWRIAVKEIIGNLRNYRILVALISLVVLLILSARLMTADHRERLENWRISQKSNQTPPVGGIVPYRLSGGTFFHNAGVGEGPPLQRPHSLSVLVKGLEVTADRPVTLGQKVGFGPLQQDNIVAVLNEAPDALFIIKLSVSLLALFFSVDAVTREKERGTLRDLLAHPIRRRELLLGKSLGMSISFLVPMAVAFASAVAYLRLEQGLLTGSGDLARAGLILSFALLYGLVFLHIGLFISTLFSNTKTALVTALLAWGTLVVVLPNVAVLAATITSPAPSQSRLNASLNEAQQRIIQEHLQGQPAGRSIFEVSNSKEVLSQVIENDRRLTDDYISRKWNQISRARTLALFSPAGALTFGTSDLADTGADSFRSYVEFLRAGRDEAIEALNARWNLSPGEGNARVAETLERINSRQHGSESIAASVRSALPAAFSLVVWTLMSALVAFLRFASYDVR